VTPAHGTLHVFEDAAALAREGAAWLAARARQSARERGGRFVLSLSGGSTPRPLYQQLALTSDFPWARTHIVFGDERFVPPDDPASNAGMAKAALLDHVPISPAQIHPVPTTLATPQAAADAYASTLQMLYGGTALAADRPLHDVCLLGLGEDGHTASLLPGDAVLAEQHRWVAVVGHGRPEVRITLTIPPLESSRAVVFLVAGAGKRAILDRMLSGGSDVPAARLRPVGEVFWFADRAAAGRWAP
jgi:6-phosphogluconolactonase